MNHIHRGILTLIRSAVTGQALPLPENFRLEDAQEMILAHQISGLCYEGAVICGIPKSHPVMDTLFKKYYRAIVRSNAQMQALDQLYAAFEENSIDYLPVKGCVLKPLYPNPAMRSMGDADVLIRMEQYDRIKPLMLRLGYTEMPEYHHELPWNNKALHLELHRYLVPEFLVLEYDHFSDVWNRSVHTGGTKYAMMPEDAFVYLFMHYAKHYRGGGIGIRQLLDLWVWQRTYPQMDMALVRKQLDSLHLLVFFENTSKMLDCWFAEKAYGEKEQYMTDYIFSSGCWGQTDRRIASQGLLKVRQAGSMRSARFVFVLEKVFPSAKTLSKQYPVLKKAPWLLPVMWPVRWVSTVLFRRQNIRHAAEGFRASNIKSFEESLSYVGLDFHV